MLTKYLRDTARDLGLPEGVVRGYRGGYLPKLRREVEVGLRDGSVRLVVATNALELGIDIGRLDVVILTGYPGRVASARQQAGRSGRRDRPGTAVLVARSNPLDQYVLQHPEALLDGHAERAALDPKNRLILTNHVRCAAFELPFKEGETLCPTDVLGHEERVTEALVELAAPDGPLHRFGGRYHWCDTSFPADSVSLNGFDIDNVAIYDLEARVVLAEVDRASSQFFVHEGAIYGHQGETYYVERFDWDGRRAYVRKVDCDYYTEAEAEVEVRTTAEDRSDDLGAFRATRGNVLVTTQVPMFKKIRYYTGENVGSDEVRLPAEQMGTGACWIDIGPQLATELRVMDGGRSQSLRGIAHLLRGVAPAFVRCDRGDLRVHSEARATATELPRIVVYDRVPNGVGLAEAVFTSLRSVIPAMRDIVDGCACRRGCPACVGPAASIGPHGKDTAARLLGALARACAEHPLLPPADLAPPVIVREPQMPERTEMPEMRGASERLGETEGA